MLATAPPPEIEPLSLAELAQPDPLEDGTQPETREILCGLSWERHLALDKAYGDDRSGPRFYYLDGSLEIMSTSEEHERIKTCIGGCVEDFFLETGLEVVPRGQATMRLAMKQAGAEPDESWCLHEAKKFPDIVLEIALTSGGINKLELYRRFEVPEVWLWLRDGLHIYCLAADASGYEESPASRLLPRVDVALLEQCVSLESWQDARRAFRAGLAARS